jgi:hypothetical protein
MYICIYVYMYVYRIAHEKLQFLAFAITVCRMERVILHTVIAKARKLNKIIVTVCRMKSAHCNSKFEIRFGDLIQLKSHSYYLVF